ncbi:MAG: hypothetical protein Q8O19_05055, partial [Rectinemataceae bacterium]|nr:hypothetical protein [Rectinemataceae bacterium]
RDVDLNLSGTTDWQYKGATDVVPNDSRIAKLNYAVYLEDTIGQLQNEGFETGALIPWTTWSSDINILTGGVTNAASHSGTYSAYMTLNGTGVAQGTLYQFFPKDVAPGQNVGFGAYFKTSNLSGARTTIRFDYRDANGGWIGNGIYKDVDLALSGTTNWQFLSGSDVVPNDSRIAKVNYTVFMEGNGSGTLYVDDAKAPLANATGTIYIDDTKAPLTNGTGTIYVDDVTSINFPQGVHTGDPLPGNSTQTFLSQTVPANGTLILNGSYYIPSETYPGYDQTHVNIMQSGLELYNNPEVGVWCPPIPLPIISGETIIQGRADQTAQLTFELRKPGQTTALYTFQVSPDSSGNYTLYTLTSVPEGRYDLSAKGTSTLRVVKKDIKVTNGKITSNVDFNLLNGDADNNNV